jgi:hypothetical protein
VSNTVEIAKLKRDLQSAKKMEIMDYCNLLKQEDEKYDFESTNMEKLESEIIKIYKKR